MQQWLHRPPADDRERAARHSIARQWRLMITLDSNDPFAPAALGMSAEVREAFVSLLGQIDRSLQ
jgi:hypothetical protein